ncbi:hypothetical protein TNCV_4203731 [Trichonephila clavipes]|nr:hypothetical protein TNCV_4203731 [Trichonephila clavipes]
MITNFFIPELNNHDVQELWFQQDGATGHTARATIDLLKDTFGDCKELLPASGNRSDKRRDREEDLATTEGKGRNGRERRAKKSRGREK